MEKNGKKQILLQIYNLIYLYYGLAAIKTAHTDCSIDVLITNSSHNDISTIIENIKDFKEIENVFVYSDDFDSKIKKIITTHKSKIFDKIKYQCFGEKNLKKLYTNFFKAKQYDEIFYCHEHRSIYIAPLKIAYPKADFIMYGDGLGIFCDNYSYFGGTSKYIKSDILEDLYPNKVISLLPVDIDGFLSKNNIPVSVTNKDIALDLFDKAHTFKKYFNTYFNLEKYNGITKCLFMTSYLSQIDELTLEEEVNMNVEIIKSKFPKGSLVIIKPHPREEKSKLNYYKQILKNEYILLELPIELKPFPIELMKLLMDNVSYLVTYGTSSLSLKYFYNIDRIDVTDILKKYGQNPANKKEILFNKILGKLPTYNYKDVIYKEEYSINKEEQ